MKIPDNFKRIHKYYEHDLVNILQIIWFSEIIYAAIQYILLSKAFLILCTSFVDADTL